ncbi:hypothetical protein [Herbaspirillum robiniae]|uniref:hypothetical protein n=1 Tax=Herbaspirillum robiniae TaxID=2014887 RepID=UPI003D76ED31
MASNTTYQVPQKRKDNTMKKQDYSGTTEYKEGYTKGTAAAGTWQIAKRTVLWKRDTRTQFRNEAVRRALRFRDIPEESIEGQAFSQGFITAYTRAFTRTCGQ